nr:hypothetical protein [Tanacetum cinerariifolium]
CDVVKHIFFDVEDALKNEAGEKASDVINDFAAMESVCDVVKASDTLKNKAADVKKKSDGKGKKSIVDKDNDKEITFEVVNEKASDALKNKAIDVKKKSVGKGNKSTIDKPNDNA